MKKNKKFQAKIRILKKKMLSLILENPMIYKILLRTLLLTEIIALTFSVCAGWLGRILFKDEYQPLKLSSGDYVTSFFVGGLILGNLGIIVCFCFRCSCRRQSFKYEFKFREFYAFLIITGPFAGLFGAKIFDFNLNRGFIDQYYKS